MKIEHIALYVNDLEGARKFFYEISWVHSQMMGITIREPIFALIFFHLMMAQDLRS